METSARDLFVPLEKCPRCDYMTQPGKAGRITFSECPRCAWPRVKGPVCGVNGCTTWYEGAGVMLGHYARAHGLPTMKAIELLKAAEAKAAGAH